MSLARESLPVKELLDVLGHEALALKHAGDWRAAETVQHCVTKILKMADEPEAQQPHIEPSETP